MGSALLCLLRLLDEPPVGSGITYSGADGYTQPLSFWAVRCAMLVLLQLRHTVGDSAAAQLLQALGEGLNRPAEPVWRRALFAQALLLLFSDADATSWAYSLGAQVREPSSVECCGPHVVIFPAMLRSSNATSWAYSLCAQAAEEEQEREALYGRAVAALSASVVGGMPPIALGLLSSGIIGGHSKVYIYGAT